MTLNIYHSVRSITASETRSISIRCPHCGHIGQFNALFGNHYSYFATQAAASGRISEMMFASIRICPAEQCNSLVFAITDGTGVIRETFPPQTIDFSSESLPARCLMTLEEAIACHSAGAYRASAMMVRRLLEEICDENQATGGNLHQRLASLKTKIVLPEDLFSAMDELKILGNDATHVEAREYDNIGEEEASLAIDLVKEILKALYQLKDLIQRLQARKQTTS